jgi:VIT1/CCC1 family predicted Fe2+/Mn2+ transporter
MFTKPSNKKESKPLIPTYGATIDHETSSNNFQIQAQEAHSKGDSAASKHIHQIKVNASAEAHLNGGGHIKSAVYGGLDGIITTFATVTSVAGSGLPHSVILILGLAHLVADGLSMGLGDMLSSQAEADLSRHERKREEWEFDNYPEGEIEEMVELYVQKGISPADARLVVETLAKYRDAFIDIMMVEELNLMPVDEESSALRGGLVTFGAFMLFGMVPLLPYLVNLVPGMHFSADAVLLCSCICTVLTLFGLGGFKGSIVGSSIWKSGGSMALNGSMAAACGWFIGFLLGLTGIKDIV